MKGRILQFELHVDLWNAGQAGAAFSRWEF